MTQIPAQRPLHLRRLAQLQAAAEAAPPLTPEMLEQLNQRRPARPLFPEERQDRRRANWRHQVNKRNACKLQRTPPWVDLEAVRALYVEAQRLTRETGIEHHVDHIIPLQGRLVSGLHVHTNMQILTASENCRKWNKFDVAEIPAHAPATGGEDGGQCDPDSRRKGRDSNPRYGGNRIPDFESNPRPLGAPCSIGKTAAHGAHLTHSAHAVWRNLPHNGRAA